MNAGERDTVDETFICRFDAMLGEDCRDSNGRLLHIRRGKLGMGLITAYLPKIDWANELAPDMLRLL